MLNARDIFMDKRLNTQSVPKIILHTINLAIFNAPKHNIRTPTKAYNTLWDHLNLLLTYSHQPVCLFTFIPIPCMRRTASYYSCHHLFLLINMYMLPVITVILDQMRRSLHSKFYGRGTAVLSMGLTRPVQQIWRQQTFRNTGGSEPFLTHGSVKQQWIFRGQIPYLSHLCNRSN